MTDSTMQEAARADVDRIKSWTEGAAHGSSDSERRDARIALVDEANELHDKDPKLFHAVANELERQNFAKVVEKDGKVSEIDFNAIPNPYGATQAATRLKFADGENKTTVNGQSSSQLVGEIEASKLASMAKNAGDPYSERTQAHGRLGLSNELFETRRDNPELFDNSVAALERSGTKVVRDADNHVSEIDFNPQGGSAKKVEVKFGKEDITVDGKNGDRLVGDLIAPNLFEDARQIGIDNTTRSAAGTGLNLINEFNDMRSHYNGRIDAVAKYLEEHKEATVKRNGDNVTEIDFHAGAGREVKVDLVPDHEITVNNKDGDTFVKQLQG